MNDLISRQAAIDALADMHCKSDEDGYVWIIRSDAWARIDALPSVTPKQKRGKWINGYCSECGKHAPFWAMASTYYKSSYCPNCGAKMDEDEKTAGAEQ